MLGHHLLGWGMAYPLETCHQYHMHYLAEFSHSKYLYYYGVSTRVGFNIPHSVIPLP